MQFAIVKLGCINNVHICLIQALLQIFSKVITFVKMLIIYTVYVDKFEMRIRKENNKIKLETVIRHQTGQLFKKE